MKKQNIVIVGTGFAGIYTYLSLVKQFKKDEVAITLISKNNYFLFTPMLHEVATGGLSEDHVVESVRTLIYKTGGNLLVTAAREVDFERKFVRTEHDDVYYDYLVLALGATTNFFDIPGVMDHAFVLKDLSDAIKIRDKFVTVFEEASHIKDKQVRQKMLSFAVIGGGPTGVELTAEMADLFFETFRMFYKRNICPEDVSLYLISRDKELLPMFDAPLRKKAHKVLEEKGVKILFKKRVTEVTADTVKFDDGFELVAPHIMWAAGVKPNTLSYVQPPTVGHGGRLEVDEYLRLSGRSDVFALGDMAAARDEDNKVLPMLAQVAVQQGWATGSNIVASIRHIPLTPFEYNSKGSLVSLGQWRAVGNTFGILWSGPLAWWVWRTVYLFNFASWPKRIKIAIDWTVNMFYPRDITKV